VARRHREHHKNDRIGWLRAAVLGANDGIISVSSIMLGVATANALRSNILLLDPIRLRRIGGSFLSGRDVKGSLLMQLCKMDEKVWRDLRAASLSLVQPKHL
jgi:VIT1/CCC1 family predicted Fe2+/Mn2+ transporter